MIFPFPDFIKHLKDSPMTMSLLMANILLFFAFFADPQKTNLNSKLLSGEMLAFTGKNYFQYIQHSQVEPLLWEKSKQYSVEDSYHMQRLGGLALKDNQFLNEAETFQFQGDLVKIRYWKSLVSKFKDDYKTDHLNLLGLSANQNHFYSWISYQFSHASFYHLFSNMIFLMFIGILLERIFSTYLVALVYILGGVAGGWLYLYYQPNTFVPVVGASGSISALMMFYVLSETKKRIRYFYFLSPFQGHYGLIYLSPLLMIVTFFLSDLAEWTGSNDFLTDGVAYTAHIGGGLLGLFMAMAVRGVLFFGRRKATS